MKHNQLYLRQALLFIIIVIAYIGVFSLQARAQTSPNITALVWSPNGNQIAGASDDGYLRIWYATTGEVALEFQAHSGAIHSLSWKPDGSRLASISSHDGVVRIWDTTNGNRVAELTGDRNPLDTALVAWNPNGDMIVGITANTDGGFPLHFWSVEGDNYQPMSISANVAAFDVQWSPDGTKLAIADYRDVYIFDDFSSSNLEPHTVIPFRFAIAWSPDGTKLAAANLDGTVQILNPQTDEILTSVGNATSDTQQRTATIAWDTDNTTLFADRFDGTMQTWDTTTGEVIETLPLNREGGRFLMSLSPYGGRLALGNSAPVSETASTQATRSDVQILANGAIQIVVPAPSLERLQAIAEACNAPAPIEQSLTASIQANQLTNFVPQVEALPENTIPPACAADLIAVARALQSR